MQAYIYKPFCWTRILYWRLHRIPVIPQTSWGWRLRQLMKWETEVCAVKLSTVPGEHVNAWCGGKVKGGGDQERPSACFAFKWNLVTEGWGMVFLAAADPSGVLTSGCNSQLYAFGQRDMRNIYSGERWRYLDTEQFAGANKGDYFLWLCYVKTDHQVW